METKQEISVQPLHHYVEKILREKIYNNEFEQGQKLAELDLAKEFGVSRSTLREAFRKLENEGLVVSKQRRGSYVKEFSKRDYTEIYEARAILEQYAFIEAIKFMTDEDIETLEQFFSQMAEKAKSKEITQFIDLDLQLHEYIVKLCNNSRVIYFYSIIKRQIRVFQAKTFLYYNSMDEILAQHRELLDAIKTKDPNIIKDALEKHIDKIV